MASTDSSIGMGLSQARHLKPGSGYIDTIGQKAASQAAKRAAKEAAR